MEPLETLCEKFNTNLERLKIYGEGRAINRKEGVAFVNVKNEPCSVSDGHDTVLFWVKNSGVPVDPGFGKQKSKRVNNSYTLAANSKKDVLDLLISLMNEIAFLTFTGYSTQTINIADQFFGLANSNHETYFFTIDFDVVENLKLETCLDC
jgi:hypothetical protein